MPLSLLAKVDRWRGAIELVQGRIKDAPIRQPEPDVVREAEVAFHQVRLDPMHPEQSVQRSADRVAHERALAAAEDAVAELRAEADQIVVARGFAPRGAAFCAPIAPRRGRVLTPSENGSGNMLILFGKWWARQGSNL